MLVGCVYYVITSGSGFMRMLVTVSFRVLFGTPIPRYSSASYKAQKHFLTQWHNIEHMYHVLFETECSCLAVTPSMLQMKMLSPPIMIHTYKRAYFHVGAAQLTTVCCAAPVIALILVSDCVPLSSRCTLILVSDCVPNAVIEIKYIVRWWGP